MIASLHIPGTPLDAYIESFFYYEGLEVSHSVDRLLPDGKNEMIIDLTETPKFIYDNESLKEIQSCHHVWTSGLRTAPISIPSGNDDRMIVISFRKGKIHHFLPFPTQEITDYVVDSDLIYGEMVQSLRTQLLECTVNKMFQVLEGFFVELGKTSLHENVQDACVAYAIDQMVHNPTINSLAALSSKIGFSQKHFIRMFKDRVGVTPKVYLRILRFQKGIREIDQSPSTSWTAIAQEAGYYDQAHFINDFRLFSGFTPGQYLERRGDQMNYIPVR